MHDLLLFRTLNQNTSCGRSSRCSMAGSCGSIWPSLTHWACVRIELPKAVFCGHPNAYIHVMTRRVHTIYTYGTRLYACTEFILHCIHQSLHKLLAFIIHIYILWRIYVIHSTVPALTISKKYTKSHICIELSASINQFSVHILSTVRDTNIGSKGKKDK